MLFSMLSSVKGILSVVSSRWFSDRFIRKKFEVCVCGLILEV